jgi:ubiquinol oxidase
VWRQGSRRARCASDDTAKEENEQWHLLILEELIAASGVGANPLRYRLVPQLLAFVLYQHFWLPRLLSPTWNCRLNADIEDHAEYEYAALVAEHPEWETTAFSSEVASGYGTYESLADLFRQIGHDEGCAQGPESRNLAGGLPGRWSV